MGDKKDTTQSDHSKKHNCAPMAPDFNNLGVYDAERAKTDTFYYIETLLERFIFESRWFLLPLFLGLIVALLMFSIHFTYLVFDFTLNLWDYQKNELLLHLLTFVDKVLVGGLIIMVIIGGYENSVSRLNITDRQRKLSWLGKLDSTTLKIKLSTAIVSISSVHLLKIFLEIDKYFPKDQTYYSAKASGDIASKASEKGGEYAQAAAEKAPQIVDTANITVSTGGEPLTVIEGLVTAVVASTLEGTGAEQSGYDGYGQGFYILAWTTGIHMVMVLTAILLTIMDRIAGKH